MEQQLKGETGERVEVWSFRDGGVRADPGERIGLVVRAFGEALVASSCDVVHPELLERAARPLPTPESTRRPTVVVGAQLGDVRTVAIDDHGDPRAFGTGLGTTIAVDVCPGAARMVEVASVFDGSERRMELAVRTLPTLDLVSTVHLPWRPEHGPESVHALSCRAADGGRVLGMIVAKRATADARMFAVEGDTVSTVWTGPAAAAVIGTDQVYIRPGSDGPTQQIDLRTLSVSTASADLLDIEPARRHALGLARDDDKNEQLVGDSQLLATAFATDDDRVWGLVSVGRYSDARPWGGTSVRSLDPPEGQPIELAFLDSPEVHAIATVPASTASTDELAWPPPRPWTQRLEVRIGGALALIIAVLWLAVFGIRRRQPESRLT